MVHACAVCNPEILIIVQKKIMPNTLVLTCGTQSCCALEERRARIGT